MAPDNAWFGVITTGIGALAGGALPAAFQAWTAYRQRKLDASEAKLKREAKAAEAEKQRAAKAAEVLAQREFDAAARRREFAARLLPERRAQIENWKQQLFDAGRQHQTAVAPDLTTRNVVGERWFEELRPYLRGSAASHCTNVATVRINNKVLSLLSDEIARIEREWIAEAQG